MQLLAEMDGFDNRATSGSWRPRTGWTCWISPSCGPAGSTGSSGSRSPTKGAQGDPEDPYPLHEGGEVDLEDLVKGTEGAPARISRPSARGRHECRPARCGRRGAAGFHRSPRQGEERTSSATTACTGEAESLTTSLLFLSFSLLPGKEAVGIPMNTSAGTLQGLRPPAAWRPPVGVLNHGDHWSTSHERGSALVGSGNPVGEKDGRVCEDGMRPLPLNDVVKNFQKGGYEGGEGKEERIRVGQFVAVSFFLEEGPP